jgi:LPXTG-motif cell wall-anchored protein
MKRRAIALGISLLLLGLVPSLASASTFTLDQSNNNFDHLIQTSNIDAQTFTAGRYGPLDSIELYLSPSPHGTVGVTIQGTTGNAASGVPNGTVLASKTLGIPASPSGNWFRFSFPVEPILTVGHVYAIVILPTDNVSLWGSKLDDYPGRGRALVFSGGSWISPFGMVAVTDWAFKTNMGLAAATPTPTHTPTHRPTTRPTPTHASTATATPVASATPTPTTAATASSTADVAGATGGAGGATQNPGSGSGSGSGGSTMPPLPILIVVIVGLLLLGGLAFLLMRRRRNQPTA